LDEQAIKGLIAFTEYRGHFAVPEGIELLFYGTEKEGLREQILQYLVKMTRTSIANRFQCFKANVLDGLLNLIRTSSCPTALVLFSQLGSSFFRISELSLTLRLISQSQNPSALAVLKSVLKMLKTTQKDVPNSFFNLHDREQFKIQSLCVPATFTIEMYAAFFASDEYVRVFLTIANSAQKFELILDKTKLVASLINGNHSYQFRLANGIERNRWYHLKISVAPTVISSSINGKLQPTSVIPTRFRFEQSASLELGHFFWALAFFTIDGDEALFHAHFNAKCVTDLKCYNTISGTAIPYADYDGLPVPFSLSFVDALVTSGGSLVVLPLFEVVSKSPEPSRYLKALLKLVSRILAKKEQLFIEQRFFRSLGSLLAKIDVRYLTLDCIGLIYAIYKSLSDPPTRKEMLQYIFSNFALWNNMDIERQNFVISAIFPGLLELDSDTFVQTISFGDLLIEFTTKFAHSEETLSLQDFTQRCWKFLLILSSIRMDRRDGELLLASALCISREEICCRSLHLLVNLISDRSPEVLRLLRDVRIFPPLLLICTSTSEVVRLTAVNTLAYAQYSLHADHFGIEMIDLIRVWAVDNTTTCSRNQILSVMTQIVSFDDFSFLTPKFQYDVVKPIMLPQ
jgi:hypothetical protein